MVDEDSHSTDLSVSGEEGHSTILLATLVSPQNCTKMLRNLTFVVQFESFSIRSKKVLVFSNNF